MLIFSLTCMFLYSIALLTCLSMYVNHMYNLVTGLGLT